LNSNLIVVLIFGLFVALLSISAVVVIVRSAIFRYKPLWIIGSLIGFIGLGASSEPSSDIYVLFGFTVPVVLIFKVMFGGPWIVKTGFPFVAIIALAKRFPIPR
jgi:hypothetical protein